MNRRGLTLIVCATVVLLSLVACRGGGKETPPPPDARRPALKTEAELSAARAERLRSGEVIATDTPVVEAERRPEPQPPPLRPTPIRPSKASIQSDILMIDDSALTVAEVLYPLQDWIEHSRSTQTPRGFREQLKRRILDHVRQEIGSLLVCAQAMSKLGEPQLASLDEALQREIDARVSRDFGGSIARLEHRIERYGLTMEQFRNLVKRQIVVSSYTREILTPQIRIRRDELLAYYRANQKRYSTDETRELLMIAVPFDRFLPGGGTWQAAPQAARAQAKLQAKRRARAAHEALAKREFANVAREYSAGVHAAEGGSWGPIGQPLQPPYDELSRRIFEFAEGQHSEPIETATGWYIVQCGKIDPATKTPFSAVQEEIRAELESQRFNQLAGDYVVELAQKATISDLTAFVDRAVERAVAGADASSP